ncbi:MAG: hypothetical protein JO250_23290, partial [Armatimonadetes bacterium]|nr:hypothetical protein [Armatimonadota bacterium]
MARNNTDNVLKFLALGALTVGCGGAIGYFVFGGTHPSQPSADATGIQQPAVPSGPAPMPPSKPR